MMEPEEKDEQKEQSEQTIEEKASILYDWLVSLLNLIETPCLILLKADEKGILRLISASKDMDSLKFMSEQVGKSYDGDDEAKRVFKLSSKADIPRNPLAR